jgi:acetyl esterase/lipase
MNTRALQLPGERSGHAAPAELAGNRQQLAAAIAAGIWRTDPPPQQLMLAGRRTLRFDPPEPARAVLLHFHGGAFRIGAPEMVGPFAAAVAKRCGVAVVCPAYRLAPEHPFPAALVDGLAVLDALGRTSDAPLLLSGDSAGGGLAASLAAIAAAQRQSIRALILLSAWLDLTLTSEGYERNAATDPLFSRAAASAAATLYLQGLSAEHALASPVRGSVAGFPPTLIVAGDGEVLADDSRRMHARLRAAGIVSHLSMIAGMEHVAVTRGLELPGSAESLALVARFIDEALVPGQ